MLKKSIYVWISISFLGLGYWFGSQTGQDQKGIFAAELNHLKDVGIDQFIRHFDGQNGKTNAKGFQFWFVPTDMSQGLLNLKLSEVKAFDASHAPHQHEEEEILLLIQGKAEFFLNGETRLVDANTSLYCPPNIPHGLRNVGHEPIRYLVIKNK